jgi:NADPH:quinone reductase-like Zn-dependent oxidoreductase
MKAMTLRTHGGPEVLTPEELPEPEAGPGQVRVRVAAVAMNHLDLWVRRGLPHLKLSYPFLLGADVAGTIDQLGAGVSGVRVGDEVVVNPGHSCGRCRECLSGRDNLCRWYELMGEDRSGGYAEKIVVPAQNVVPKPPSLSMPEAAAITSTSSPGCTRALRVSICQAVRKVTGTAAASSIVSFAGLGTTLTSGTTSFSA